MGEITLEGLQALIEKAIATANQAAADATEAKATAAEALTTAQEAAGAKALSAAEAKAILEPAKIPDQDFEHDGKKYRFLKAKLRLAGDPKTYTAVEVGATAGVEGGLFAKVVGMAGQQLLRVVV